MMPGLRFSLAITAHKAANDTMMFPTNSSRTASHLNKKKKILINTMRKDVFKGDCIVTERTE